VFSAALSVSWLIKISLRMRVSNSPEQTQSTPTAAVEIALARLVASLLGTKPDLAGIILFRISNARARNKAIELLIKKKYGAKFNSYWNSVFKFITQLDQTRNEIVHWHMRITPNFGRTGKLTSATTELVPLNIWEHRRGKGRYSERDLINFSLKCEFAEAAVWSFVTYVAIRRGHRKMRATWRDICQRALVYPPPDNHPICQRWPKARILLAPSRS
jgi:hypothetical protein